MTRRELRFLADENCDFAIVRALRQAGFDVVALAESASRTVDRDVIRLAHEEERILITEDKDFGWLVFVSRVDAPGVVLVRFPSRARATIGAHAVDMATTHGASLTGAFVVLEPGQLRVQRRE